MEYDIPLYPIQSVTHIVINNKQDWCYKCSLHINKNNCIIFCHAAAANSISQPLPTVKSLDNIPILYKCITMIHFIQHLQFSAAAVSILTSHCKQITYLGFSYKKIDLYTIAAALRQLTSNKITTPTLVAYIQCIIPQHSSIIIGTFQTQKSHIMIYDIILVVRT